MSKSSPHSAGAAATKDGSVAAEQAGSLRRALKAGEKGKPTKDWRCKDRFDPGAADWEADCSAVTAGKVGHDQDTCQPCCECDCNTSADVPEATASKTCDVEVEFDTSSTLTCADHGHAEVDNGSCDTDAVEAECEAICFPTTTAATTGST